MAIDETPVGPRASGSFISTIGVAFDARLFMDRPAEPRRSMPLMCNSRNAITSIWMRFTADKGEWLAGWWVSNLLLLRN